MSAPVTIADVARLADVSTVTVSKTSVPDTFRRFRLGRHQQVDQVTQA